MARISSRVIGCHSFDDHLPPGDGGIAWAPLGRQLADADFRGALILEFASGPPPEQMPGDARRGRKVLRQVSRELNLRHLIETEPTAE